jgi:hypothetical protein
MALQLKDDGKWMESQLGLSTIRMSLSITAWTEERVLGTNNSC